MPGVTRIAQDSAGGVLIGILAPTVFVNGKNIAVEGDKVEAHEEGEHLTAVMQEHSANVFAHGIPICRRGDVATCGHPATGSGDVFSGDR